MKIGMIFPGQGSQYLGMGKHFYDTERVVQEYFEEATFCLEKNFVKLCFSSSEAELVDTTNAQTAIFLVSSAIYQLLRKKYGIVPDIVAGHSLGEYSALYAAGGISFPDGLYLLTKRAHFMDEATKKQDGSMLAVLGMSYEKLQRICDQCNVPGSMEKVAEIVNYNSTSQFVVSGTRDQIDLIRTYVPIFGGKTILLKVAGAFHSRLMKEAEHHFSQYLVKVDFSDLSVPLVSNVDATKIHAADDVKKSLVKQTSSPVLWWQGMQHFKECDLIIEVGPGKSFSRLLKREWPDKHIFSINSNEDIVKLMHVYDKLCNR